MDSQRFPATSTYWHSLPAGLSSFPDCKAKAEATLAAKQKFQQLSQAENLPPEIAAAVMGIKENGQWIPDVLGVLVRLLVKDLERFDDHTFLRWNHELAAEVFKRPLNRALM